MTKKKKTKSGKYERIYRTYTLDDGRIVTIKELMDLTGIPQAKLYYRLTKSRNLKHLSQPLNKFKNRHRSAFKETYKDTPPEIMKLLFGKW